MPTASSAHVPTVKRSGEPTFKELMTRGNYVPGPTTMCRIDTLNALGGYDESIRIEDYSLVLKLTYRGMRVVVLPRIAHALPLPWRQLVGAFSRGRAARGRRGLPPHAGIP